METKTIPGATPPQEAATPETGTTHSPDTCTEVTAQRTEHPAGSPTHEQPEDEPPPDPFWDEIPTRLRQSMPNLRDPAVYDSLTGREYFNFAEAASRDIDLLRERMNNDHLFAAEMLNFIEPHIDDFRDYAQFTQYHDEAAPAVLPPGWEPVKYTNTASNVTTRIRLRYALSNIATHLDVQMENALAGKHVDPDRMRTLYMGAGIAKWIDEILNPRRGRRKSNGTKPGPGRGGARKGAGRKRKPLLNSETTNEQEQNDEED